MLRLLLVRHATSVPPTNDGPDDYSRPLSPLGMRQALDLVDVLVAGSPVRVLSSPYLRSVQTVAPTAEALGLRVKKCSALREWDSGIPVTNDWKRQYRLSWEQPKCLVGVGESLETLEERAVAALREMATNCEDGADVLVGSHGTWIARALLGLGCDVDADFWLSMASPAVFVIESQGDLLYASSRGLPL
jgi:2,3-bisphosphoglycerate-dependent phosphoglycerate mutase